MDKTTNGNFIKTILDYGDGEEQLLMEILWEHQVKDTLINLIALKTQEETDTMVKFLIARLWNLN